MKNLKDLPASERPLFGKLVNEARVKIEAVIEVKSKQLFNSQIFPENKKNKN